MAPSPSASTSSAPFSGRDLRLDSLRGLMLLVMTINHLPTGIRIVTDGSIGIFTAAEGFVFLSGLLAGMVYTKKLRAKGRPALHANSVSRAYLIYRWHIGSFLAALVAVQLVEHISRFCSQTAPQLFYHSPWLAVALGSVLLYQPGLLDLLPMYCCFVLLMPLVLPALEQGRRGWVLALSAAAWLAVQGAPPIDGAPLYPLHVGSFNLFAWQFLFVAGLVIGHARMSGQSQVARPSPWIVLASIAVVAYGIGLRHWHWSALWPNALFGIFLNKSALGLYRLADFGCFAYLIAVLADRAPRVFIWRPIAFLGQHSLPVVAAQSVAIMVLLQFSRLFANETNRTLVALGVVALLFVAAALHRTCTAGPKPAPSAPPSPAELAPAKP